jgi:hypothetical protein
MALPVWAQFGFFGGGGQSGDALLQNKSVQKELKLTEKQTEALDKIQQDSRTKMREAFQDAAGDQEKIREAMQDIQKESAKALKKFKEGLTKEQKTRFAELEYQVAAKTNDLGFLKREDIQKALKFTDKQKKLVKTTEEGLAKDVKEVFDDAKENMDFSSLRTKIPKLRKEAYESVSKTFDDDQKKVWKEKSGKAFEYKADPFPGKGKKFGKKKKDDDE